VAKGERWNRLKVTQSSSLGLVTTKWMKLAATDGPNFKKTVPWKGKFASRTAMKLTSSRDVGDNFSTAC